VCVVFDLVFDQTMYRHWIAMLPGVTWISWGSFFLGLVETFAYGLFFGLVFAPLYNFFFSSRSGATRPDRRPFRASSARDASAAARAARGFEVDVSSASTGA
jgi:hypothetical protein